jgi:MFS transporter, DHA1 family, inner membrane transport protein
MATGSVALLMLGVQPIVLGEMLSAGRVSLEGVGMVAMAEIVALGLGVLWADRLAWLSRVRPLCVAAAVGTAGLNLVTPWCEGDGALALVRLAAGLLEGLLLWVTTAVIVRSAQPARMAGVFFVVQTAAQALLGLVLARWVLPAHGWAAAFTWLAAASALPVLLWPGLPRVLPPLAARAPAPASVGARPALRPLLAAFLLMGSLGAFWAYAEPLGLGAGLDGPTSQTVIAMALVAQIVGGTMGTALVRRLPAAGTLVVSALVLGAIGWSVSAGLATGDRFFPLCMVFAFTWLFMAPFHTAFAFAEDRTGRAASLMPVAQLIGSAAGPLVASLFVEGDDAGRAALVCALFAATSLPVLMLRWPVPAAPAGQGR